MECADRCRRSLPRSAPLVFAALALLLSGCTSLREYVHNCFKVGPDYKRPPAPVAEQWIDAADVRVRSETPDDSHWWTLFGDPTLDSLVQSAYRQNLTVREAGFRVLRSRAELGYTFGELFPKTQQAFAEYQRTAISNTVANRRATPELYYDVFELGFNLSWELDFWGRFRRAVAASAAELDASVENYDDVLVTLVSDVAEAYLQIRTHQTQLDYVQQNAALQRKTLELVKVRFADGAVSELDVTQAKVNLARTEALIPPLEVQIRRAANQLCVLLGIPPECLTEKLGPGAIPTVPTALSVGIPSELLRRRPDVRKSERELAAQGERIGIAMAELYPQIFVNGTIGYESAMLKRLFNQRSFIGGIGPTMNWDILNYGRNLNHIREEDARFQELVASYQGTVLNANREVENGLAEFLQAQEQVEALRRAVEAGRRSVELVLIQYREGRVDFNRVFVMQRNLVEDLDRLAAAQGQLALSLVEVYRALGGGWQIRCGGETTAPPNLPPGESKPADALPMPRPLKKGREG